MQTRLFKVSTAFLLIFISFYADGKDTARKNDVNKPKTATTLRESLKRNLNSPFNYDIILNNAPVQVFNIQHHRLLNFSHGINNRSSAYIISVSYLNFICGQGNSELSHFRRLILFPFHDFW